MGRLFWKLFLVIWLAMSGTFTVGYILFSFGLDTGPKFAVARTEAQFAASSLKRLVELDGPDAIRPSQNAWSTPPFDLVISARLLPPGETAPMATSYTYVAQASHNGRDYVISVAPNPTALTWQPFAKPYVTAAAISMLAALLLARYLSRPIQLLRLAMHSVAEGRFETRISPLMGARRDELADLGSDADRMAAQLEQFRERKKRLMHDISHELRSPLARMKAACGVAQQNPARAQDMMNRIDREVERIDFLVEEILTLARLEAAKTSEAPLARNRVDLIDILTAIVDDASFEGLARGVNVKFDATQVFAGCDQQASQRVHGSFVCEVNSEMIYRGFENVIRNAVKFTGDGTTVRVEARRMNGGAILVRVTDQGPGITPGETEHIFEPFQKGLEGQHASRGHGLGLAIAKQAFEYHQGTISAQNSKQGSGLTVEIVLPEKRRT